MLLKVASDANFPGKLEGVLLCGGRSSRMGRDKALIEIDGEALWLRQRRLLKTILGNEPLLSVRNETRLSGAGVDQSELRYVYDDGSSGPLGGILAAFDAVASTPATHLAVLAVDLPFMEIAWWKMLEQACAATRGAVGRQAGDDGWEPVAAIYPRTMLPALRLAKEQGRLSLQRLVAAAVAERQLSEVVITPAQVRLFRNWNRPEDI